MSRLLIASLLVAASASALTVSTDSSLPTVELTVTQPKGKFLHHQEVTLSWKLTSGTYDPVNDWVSAWWLPFAATYTEFYNVTGNTGSTTFNLLNARHGYNFKYYRNNTLVATSNSIYPEGSYPMQIHTQYVPEHPDRAWVIWVSNRTSGKESVMYGTSPSSLDMNVAAMKSTTYTQQQLNAKVGLPPISIRDQPFENIGSRGLRCMWGTCYNDFTGSELFVDPGYIHVAELTGLPPNTKIYFQAGESNGYMSETKTFNSRIPAGADQSIQVLYVADAGAGRTEGQYSGGAAHNAVPIGPANGAEGARHVWDAILRDPLHPKDQASIMNGDISYARGWPWVWELFHNQTEEIFGPAPVMATYGNHEFDYGKNPFYLAQNGGSGGEAGIPTGIRFNFPSETQPWYHMRQGPAHFIALSSEHSVSEQAYWMRSKVFPNVNRTLTPFVIVFFHRPYHMSSTWLDFEMASEMEKGYSDMFSREGVDAVLFGHAHYYERMCTINSGGCFNKFRPAWSLYPGVNFTTSDMNSCITKTPAPGSKKGGQAQWHHDGVSADTCKTMCMNQDDCTGTWASGNDCYMITCPQPLNVQPGINNVYSLERKAGTPPAFFLDGTAGGVHVPNSSPTSPITEYKDFDQWGYSRLNINGTDLHWRHYHIDGSLVDEVHLKPNPI